MYSTPYTYAHQTPKNHFSRFPLASSSPISTHSSHVPHLSGSDPISSWNASLPNYQPPSTSMSPHAQQSPYPYVDPPGARPSASHQPISTSSHIHQIPRQIPPNAKRPLPEPAMIVGNSRRNTSVPPSTVDHSLERRPLPSVPNRIAYPPSNGQPSASKWRAVQDAVRGGSSTFSKRPLPSSPGAVSQGNRPVLPVTHLQSQTTSHQLKALETNSQQENLIGGQDRRSPAFSIRNPSAAVTGAVPPEWALSANAQSSAISRQPVYIKQDPPPPRNPSRSQSVSDMQYSQFPSNVGRESANVTRSQSSANGSRRHKVGAETPNGGGINDPSPSVAGTLPVSAREPNEVLPTSLAFKLAKLSLDDEKRRRAFNVADDPVHNIDDNSTSTQLYSLDDTPPKPLRDLSNTVAEVGRMHAERPAIPKLSFSDADDQDYLLSRETKDVGKMPAPTVPKITFGSELESDESDPEMAPSITVSVAAPTISVTSSEALGIEISEPTSATSRVKKMNGPRDVVRKGGLFCGGCGESIIGRIVSAMGVRWHPQCFRCSVCDELLEHVSAYEHEGRPYCHLDYHERFGPECYHCKTPIIDEKFITLDDPSLGKRTYHEQHFFCAECGDPFIEPTGNEIEDDIGFTVYRGYAYCEACHVRLRMPKCTRCKRSIRDGMPAVEALGGKWCQPCFCCAGCDKPFDDPAFYQRGNKPFCENCFSIIVKSELE